LAQFPFQFAILKIGHREGADSLRAFFFSSPCRTKGADSSAPFSFLSTTYQSQSREPNLKKRKDYLPAGHLGTKRMGELAELAFMYRAASEGIGVARPYGDSHAYDFLTQHGRLSARASEILLHPHESPSIRIHDSGSPPDEQGRRRIFTRRH
jgi:hypothetical protein